MLKRFARYFVPHRKLFTLDLTCAFLVGLTDEFMPMIVRNMINTYIPQGNGRLIVRWCWILLVIYLFKLGLNLVIHYWGHMMGVRLQADMRRDLFQHIEKLPIAYFDDHKTGAIMSRITNDLQEISEMAHHGPENLFTSAVMLAVSAFLLAKINLRLTGIVYACLPLALLFMVKIRKGQMEAFHTNRVRIGEINGETETSIAGVRITRAYGALKREMQKFDLANQRYIETRSRSYRYLAVFQSGMTFFADMMYLVVIVFGGLFYFQGKINAGDFVAYLLYISMFLTPIKKLVETYEQIMEGLSGYARFEEIMAIPIEKDSPGAMDVGRLYGAIDFHDVTFHYKTQDEERRNVIEHMHLHVPAGHTVALVGPSGGGKSTICNLIPRFYEIDAGSITIDGMDIRKMTRASLRRNIGMVAQDVFLFNGTIRDNIAYGSLDADDEAIEQAARKANIHDDIMQMPHGYDTDVGERGVHLSGGQRQRISIARIFLKNPQILILDEATSALDNATEMAIQKELDALSKGRTVIVVAHRLSTVRHADEILVVTREGIIERGKSEELLKQNGLYAQLYRYQFTRADVL